MGLRVFKMPADADVAVEVVKGSFHYPENPEWSLDTAEVEDTEESMKTIKKLWWVFRVLWPPIKNMFLGYVWEEDGKPVGLCNVMRRGQSTMWEIGNVSVLPEYRRRGIARHLVEACVELAQSHGAEVIRLDVIEGNLPAYTLYQNLGFVPYTNQNHYEFNAPAPPKSDLSLHLEATHLYEWRTRYELAKKIIPDFVQCYEPVSEARYKVPKAFRLLIPLFKRVQQLQSRHYLVYSADGQLVGTAQYSARKNGKGVQHISLLLDLNYLELATSLLQHLVYEVKQIHADPTLEIILPHWQLGDGQFDPTTLGFTHRLTMNGMGMRIER